MSLSQQRKGKKGERTARLLLKDRDYAIYPLRAGQSTCDILAEKDGISWAVEVKDCEAIAIGRFLKQARENATKEGARWMLMCHLPTTRSWLVMRQGNYKPTVWNEGSTT